MLKRESGEGNVVSSQISILATPGLTLAWGKPQKKMIKN